MKLLSIENYQLKVADEALLVKPIRDLFNADKSKNKENFYSQCSIIFFMADPLLPTIAFCFSTTSKKTRKYGINIGEKMRILINA